MSFHLIAILASLVVATALPVHAQTLDDAESACAAAKLKATGKKAKAKLKCEATAIKKELAEPDPECIAKAEEKFLKAFAKAEAKGGCVSEGDAAAVEANVDSFVAEQTANQETGAPDAPPSCGTPGTSCGSCGSGVCAAWSGGGNACAQSSGAVTTPCTSDSQCPDGMHCFAASGISACAFPCP
ncbi:MAG TPA: hypothetical protein VEC57_19060 [Candidatus Limnocylindrales bacterium]|nr:hypothetical protein [Candidatus Limnocylindrales bacterium]